MEALKASLPRGMTLEGLKIVIDCANGAAYGVAPKLLWELGAEVIELGTQPNGFNINVRCGSTAPEAMCAAVLEHGATSAFHSMATPTASSWRTSAAS